MIRNIDLNSDLGEGFGPWAMGDDAEMLRIVSSANIACGGHAGDPETMYGTILEAQKNNVCIGAHPGYNDREGFGRRIIPMSVGEVGRMIAAQVGSIMSIASLAGARVQYVKPHGALGNLAARDKSVADEIASSVQKIDPDLAILAISGTELEVSANEHGADVFSEIFADRGYLKSGQLVPRGQDGALIENSEEAVARILKFLETGLMPTIDGEPIKLRAHSICVHGDTPNSVLMAQEIRDGLEANNIAIKPFIGP